MNKIVYGDGGEELHMCMENDCPASLMFVCSREVGERWMVGGG